MKIMKSRAYPSIWKPETVVQGQPGLQMRPYLKKKTKPNNKGQLLA